MKQFQVGLIGVGAMAQYHIRNIQETGVAKIVAVCDVDTAVLEKLSVQLGVVSGKRYTSFNQLVEDKDVHAVVSVTPNHVHASIIESCLQAGKPLMTEKPFTRELEEARQLLRLYEQQPIPTMVGFIYRYTPAFRYARELIRSGKLGKLNHYFIQYLQGWGSKQYNRPYGWKFNKDFTGMGALGDLGSHMIDMARFLFGEFAEVSGQLKTIVSERMDPATGNMVKVEVDDFASFQARMTDGAMGVFQTTRNGIGSGNQHEVSIYADRGTIHASTLDPEHVVWIVEEERDQIARTTIEVPKRCRVKQWDDFMSLLEGTTPDGLPDFMDGYRNQEILDAIFRASENKTVINV